MIELSALVDIGDDCYRDSVHTGVEQPRARFATVVDMPTTDESTPVAGCDRHAFAADAGQIFVAWDAIARRHG